MVNLDWWGRLKLKVFSSVHALVVECGQEDPPTTHDLAQDIGAIPRFKDLPVLFEVGQACLSYFDIVLHILHRTLQ